MKVLDIVESKKNPKEKTELIVSSVKQNKLLIKEVIEILKNGKDVEKGFISDSLKHISAELPEILVPYTEAIIEYINYKAPRVTWGVMEAVGNISKQFPEKTASAVPKLMLNTKSKSTVVRWCSAYALSEIAKHNKKLQKELVKKIKAILKTEANNGVKNVYQKALGLIEI